MSDIKMKAFDLLFLCLDLSHGQKDYLYLYQYIIVLRHHHPHFLDTAELHCTTDEMADTTSKINTK